MEGFGNIYCIQSLNDESYVYVGMTKLSLEKRLKNHIYDYNYWKEGKIRYVSSFKIFELGEPKIDLLEKCPIKMLLEKEKEYINKLKDNFIVCNIIGNEDNIGEKGKNDNRTEEVKEKEKEHLKKYYQENKDKINERRKIDTIRNKQSNKEIRRRYYLKNQEKIKERVRK